jgi:hypothetical protein
MNPDLSGSKISTSSSVNGTASAAKSGMASSSSTAVDDFVFFPILYFVGDVLIDASSCGTNGR